MTSSSPTTETSFTGFVSYSRDDLDAVRALHSALEARYLDLPRSKGSPERISLVLDEEEFDSGDSLPSIVQDHLQRSRSLLVMCSPSSVNRSNWVRLEIESFRELHGADARILPVLVRADDPIAWHHVPASLRRQGEPLPLLPDARGGPNEEALLRILAWLLREKVAVLKGRHARYQRARRRQRWRRVAAASLVLLAGTLAGLYASASPGLEVVATMEADLQPQLVPVLACEDPYVLVGGDQGLVHLAHRGAVTSIQAFEDGHVGSAAWDGSAFVVSNLWSADLLWIDPGTASVRASLRHPGEVDWVRVLMTPRGLFAGDDEGRVWKVRPAGAELLPGSPSSDGERVEALAWDSGILLALDAGGRVTAWAPDGSFSERAIEDLAVPTGFAAIDGAWIVSGLMADTEVSGVWRVDGPGEPVRLAQLRSGSVAYPVSGVQPGTFLLVHPNGQLEVRRVATGAVVDSLQLAPAKRALTFIGPLVAREGPRGLRALDAQGLHHLRPVLRSALGFQLPTW